jgi:hypothetical protein
MFHQALEALLTELQQCLVVHGSLRLVWPGWCPGQARLSNKLLNQQLLIKIQRRQVSKKMSTGKQIMFKNQQTSPMSSPDLRQVPALLRAEKAGPPAKTVLPLNKFKPRGNWSAPAANRYNAGLCR